MLAFTAGCGETARLSVRQGMGPDPALPQPQKPLLPTVNIAPAVGWPEGTAPTPAAGLAVNALARGLDHPRWLYVLPNGDVLVAETNAPQTGKSGIEGLKGLAMKAVMKRAGAAVPSADRITLLRDTDRDGVAEARSVFLGDLHSPFGMALVGDTLYVANTDAVVAFPYKKGAMSIEAEGRKLADLPDGPRNHHWTKSLVANEDGSKLYVGVGSNSNIAEHGMQEELNRAAVLEIDTATGDTRVFASGLRNPVGIDWQPQSGALWVAVNERDELGNDVPPDYMTRINHGDFYGWPYAYYGRVDERVQPQRLDLVDTALVPDYALGPHTASLGLAFYDGELLPRFRNGALVGQHGSWNRRPASGYKVIFVPFRDGLPSALPEDVLTGFVDVHGNARGRPVGVAVAGDGAVLVADDVGNVVWRVVPTADPAQPGD
ncbi:MAG: sorbosone dehydrogenase family protein [Pseudomonadota bacterium]|nr:sorbosone dehydrogenase family protein [Pseudomonadota bacterium]